MLQPIDLPSSIDQIEIPQAVAQQLALMRSRIETFQDCWLQHRAEQFVAADYELVFQTLTWLKQTQPLNGRRFLEWGCGFAVVSCLALEFGWAPHAVEAHPDLIAQARKTIESWSTGASPSAVDLFHGNFLPRGCEQLADDPTLPSLGHAGASPYDAWELGLDDFSIVYSYPWPGEDEFHEIVFDRDAADGALLLMFIGPNEMRLQRKIPRSRRRHSR
jgi:hypothetical protein